MMRKIMMPILKYFWPVEMSEVLEEASSMPPTMQRIRAIIVGSCTIWIMRLRRELAVARLVIILPLLNMLVDVKACLVDGFYVRNTSKGDV